MNVLKMGSSSVGPPVLFLHGFPGIASKQNRELAGLVAGALERESQVLLYSGLGHAPGRFGFTSCMREVVEWFASESEKLGTVDVVGHSWGGFLSLVLASRFPSRIGRLVLMSPLLNFPAANLSPAAFAELVRENPQIDLGPGEALALDFHQVAAQTETVETMAARVTAEVLILQAEMDPITPPIYAQALVPAFPNRPELVFLKIDHSFLTERPAVAKRIAEFLGQSSQGQLRV